MMRLAHDFGTMVEKPTVPGMSANVVFASSRFPNYRIGVFNQMLDARNDPRIMSMKEVIARETAQLLEQQMRLSVRDLASKFERGLAAAARLSDEARLREAASLEKNILLKKLSDALESLKGRVGGANRADVQEVINMVESLAVKLAQGEGELIQDKAEVKKLANFLKQASEDAKKLVNEERAFACAEIESAKAAVQRVEDALREHERSSRAPSKEELEELMKDIQEARLIKMFHRQSKVMNMEHELQALRSQLAEKTKRSLELQKQLAMIQKGERNVLLYELNGAEALALGSYLEIQPSSNEAPELSKCSIQWYRVLCEGGKKEIISAPGLGSYVDLLVCKHDTEFNAVVTQVNGIEQMSKPIHILHVGKMRMKLSKGGTTIAKEFYSNSMQLCGVRGGGNAAAQALFWQASRGVSFILAFESELERNAAIMLTRRFAFDCNITLVGPSDGSPEVTP